MFIYVTCANAAEAKRIAGRLLNERLIACANWWPVQSAFRWKGKVDNCGEVALLLKTNKQVLKKVQLRIKEMHSCELPAIVVINSTGTSQVEKWVKQSVQA